MTASCPLTICCRQNFNRVAGLDSRTVMNLHSTRAAVADNFVEVFFLDALEKFRANLHGNFVLVFAETVIARNAATARVSRLNFCAGFFQNVLRGQSDSL